MNNIDIESYNRASVCCSLKDFDKIFANEDDFVEVCEWKNCLGYDISINDTHYSLSHGEFEAIKYLIAHLNRENEE